MELMLVKTEGGKKGTADGYTSVVDMNSEQLLESQDTVEVRHAVKSMRSHKQFR